MDTLINVIDRSLVVMAQGIGYIIYYPKTAGLILVCSMWAFLGITWLMDQKTPEERQAKFLAKLKKEGKLL